MTDTKSPLRIDIVSEVMCPWCIIGYRQLATALEASDVDHEIHWHPFELNPNMPPEGQDIGEHLAEKYRTTPEQSAANRAMMTARGKELGFEFNFADGFRMHNTFNTHQLLHWANVRRQGFWDQWRPKLRESLAHLIGLIMRLAGGDASVAFRVSFV